VRGLAQLALQAGIRGEASVVPGSYQFSRKCIEGEDHWIPGLSFLRLFRLAVAGFEVSQRPDVFQGRIHNLLGLLEDVG